MKLLGLGDNVFDAYLFRDELYPGGNAANVSVLARRIGAEYTGYLGVLADDPPGRHFLAALREESVEVSRVRIGVGKSACNYIVLDDHGDRTFSGNNGKETVQNLFSLHLTPQDLAYAAAFDVIHTSIHSGISNAVLGGLSRRADLSMDFSNDGFTHTNVAELAPILRLPSSLPEKGLWKKSTLLQNMPPTVGSPSNLYYGDSRRLLESPRASFGKRMPVLFSLWML